MAFPLDLLKCVNGRFFANPCPSTKPSLQIGAGRHRVARRRSTLTPRSIGRLVKRLQARLDIGESSRLSSNRSSPYFDEAAFADIIASPALEEDQGSVIMDVKYYTKWIHHCAVSRKMAEAENVFVEMKSKGLVPNVFTYTAMMRGYFLAGENDKVFKWYRRMRKANVLPTLVTQGTLLTACAAKGNLRKAAEVLKEFRGLGMEPDISGLNTLMHACVQAGNLSLTVKVYDQIELLQLQKSVFTYNIMINAYAELGPVTDKAVLLEEGFRLRDEIVLNGMQCDMQTYNALIKLCLRLYELEKGLEVFEEMKERGICPDVRTYSLLIDGFARHKKQFPKADLFRFCTDLICEMEEKGIHPNTHTYNSLMKVSVRLGDHAKAVRIMEVMEKKGVPADIVTYGTLIDSCVKNSPLDDPNEDLQECFHLVDVMRRRGLHPNCEIVSMLLNACARACDLLSAEGFFSDMKKEDIHPNRVVYTSLMKVYLSVDDVAGALKRIAEMETQGFSPNVYAFNSLLGWYVGHNMKTEAVKVISTMKSRRIQPNTVTKKLLNELRKMGRERKGGSHVQK